jgi:3-isopropylmalate/(R)-2-methylmalate dehydratase large subunit
MNMVEKILAKASGKKEVVPGEIVIADVDVIVMHDFGTHLVSNVFDKETKYTEIPNPDKVVIVIDHWFSPAAEDSATILRDIRAWAKKHGIKHLYDGGSGICHYVMFEEGFVRPGMVVVGTDSHTTCYGAFGAFGTGVGNQSHASLGLVFGKGWFRVPKTIKVQIDGELPKGTNMRDVVQHVIGVMGEDGAVYKAVEFAGSFVDSCSVLDRFTLPLMSVEMGAKTGFIQPDDKVIEFIKQRTNKPFELYYNDPDVEYESVHYFDVSKLGPQIGCPPTVGNTKSIEDVPRVTINQAVIGGCAGAKIEDFRLAAEILRGRKVHPEVRMLIIPGSRQIYMQAAREGLLDLFFEAGANIFPPSCGTCQTVNMGAQAAGEVMIATLPRNFPGRTGSPQASVYLASPMTVAASAIEGRITDPREFLGR